jgi:hypothetical protein
MKVYAEPGFEEREFGREIGRAVAPQVWRHWNVSLWPLKAEEIGIAVVSVIVHDHTKLSLLFDENPDFIKGFVQVIGDYDPN